MKKVLLSMCLILSALFTFSQSLALQDVFVEKIPVSAAAQAADPKLNANSVTYRIFIKLAPEWRLSTVQGLFANPLLFITSTQFYNTADIGTSFPTYRPIPNMSQPLYYDSWITIGSYSRAASASKIVPLFEDNTDGIRDGFILGAAENPSAIDPATQIDLIWGDQMGPSADYGLEPAYEPENVIYYAAGGVAGATASNYICIGQWTTNGDFTFELGFQAYHPTRAAQNYVYRDATVPGGFIYTPLAFYTTINAAPVVSLVAPTSASTYTTGDLVNMAATASDTDGTITRVEFLVNGVVVGQDLTAPYEFAWASTAGIKNLTAIAYDNGGKSTTSAPVSITVNAPPANQLPVATITAPAAGTQYDVKDVPTASINIAATASDPDGSVTLVEFFVNGTKVGEDATSPYEYTYITSVLGSYSITAIATDNLGIKGNASAPVNVSVINSGVSFQLGNESVMSVACHSSSVFCVPVKRINSAVTNATGFDFELSFDHNLVSPTGKIYVSNDMTNERQTGVYFRQEGNNKIYAGVYFVSGNATFNGTGDILCVEFARNIGFATGAQAQISLTSIKTSYSNSAAVNENLPNPFTYTIFNNTIFEGSLSFWADNSPLRGGPGYAPTVIRSTANSSYEVQPDVNGIFRYDFSGSNGKQFNINKANPGVPSTWNDPVKTKEIWSSYDALLAQKVIVNDPTFIPNVFQIIAMDVNLDGVVTAGDITQIMRRSVETIEGFSHVIAGSRRWSWLPTEDLNSDLKFRISNTWPADDGVGYSKNRVPFNTGIYTINAGDDSECAFMESKNFKAILLGDVDGSYRRVVADGIIKSGVVKNGSEKDLVLVDLASATKEEKFINIPVRLYKNDNIKDLDLVLSYNGKKLQFESIVSHTSFVQMEFNNINNQHISVSSISSKAYPVEEKLFTLRFYSREGFSKEDILQAVSFINGVQVETMISDPAPLAVDNNFDQLLRVYPNPARDMLKVELPEAAKVQLISMEGRVLYTNLYAEGVEEINVGLFADGIYMLRISNNKVSTVRQVIIKK